MAEANYYVRIRGKVTGPFDKSGLEKLVRRGMLSRIHEISEDRAGWNSAGDYEDLFPSGAAVGATVVPGSTPSELVGQSAFERAESPAIPSFGADGGRYFYSQSGGAVGPVGLNVLTSLAKNGTLRANDLVWRENAEVGVPAQQLPILSTIYSNRLPYSEPALARAEDPKQRMLWEAGCSLIDSISTAVGVAAGAMLIVLLDAPWAVVNGRAIWWWDLYHAGNAGGLAATGTWVALTGIALCMVGPLLKGVARAITYVCVTATLLLFVSVGAFRFNVGTLPSLGLVAPVALAALVGVCMARRYMTDAVAPRTLLAVLSGLAGVSAVSMVILWMTDAPSLYGVPDPVIFGYVLCLLGMFATLATSVLGFVGLKPQFTPALNRATAITALCAIVLPELGGLIAVVGGLSSIPLPWVGEESWFRLSDMRGIVAQALARLILMWCAVLAVLAVGLAELLVRTYQTPRRPSP